MDLCDRSSLSKAQTNPATGRVMPESLEDAKPKVQADLRTVLPPPAPDAENTWDWGIWQTVADKLEADLINLEEDQNHAFWEEERGSLLAEAHALFVRMPGLSEDGQKTAWSQLGRIHGAISRLCQLLGR